MTAEEVSIITNFIEHSPPLQDMEEIRVLCRLLAKILDETTRDDADPGWVQLWDIHMLEMFRNAIAWAVLNGISTEVVADAASGPKFRDRARLVMMLNNLNFGSPSGDA
jgi:hypothetical protein